MPKIELHAHLNGSCRDSTIVELAKGLPNVTLDQCKIASMNNRTLAECFKLFDVIHKCTATLAAVRRIAREVVEDFANDGVVYLELRTTPRCGDGFSSEDYVDTVLDGIREAQIGRAIVAKLLLSINRRQSVAAAEQTVQLAIRRRLDVDFSGDPSANDAAAFAPILRVASDAGCRLALHVAELPRHDDTLSLLQCNPHRVGHCVFLNDEATQLVRERRTPIEFCLTSNVKTQSVKSASEHHLQDWLAIREHPICLCTDDSGVFETSLSNEYAIAASALKLSRRDLFELSQRSINVTNVESTIFFIRCCSSALSTLQCTFATEDERQQLRELFQRFATSNQYML